MFWNLFKRKVKVTAEQIEWVVKPMLAEEERIKVYCDICKKEVPLD